MRILSGLSLFVLAAGVQAQAYPAKPVRMIVGFPPGGTNDIVARIQAGADHNIERFGLLAGEGEGAELPGA